MHRLIDTMLKRYNCNSIEEIENALKEIMQEIALLGMWRAKFFEIGAFYGGTALRILHGLDRFSEDMDFSLLAPDKSFDISKYENSLKRELAAYGFEVTVEKKKKNLNTDVESAFIKANTLIHFIKIKSNYKIQKNKFLKIKLEVDTNPPGDFETEVISHFNPIPFSVKAFSLPTLFAGKIAATLYRPYKFNTKGRDWYDFLWYISSGTHLNVQHLAARMVQLDKWHPERLLTINDVRTQMYNRINELNLNEAIKDVLPFVKDRMVIENWSKDLFRNAVKKIR